MQYLTLKEYSEKTGISVRTLRDRCKKGGYYLTKKVCGNGGEQYVIADSAGETILVTNHNPIVTENTASAVNKLLKEFGLYSEKQSAGKYALSEKQRKTALNKVDLIEQYNKFIKSCKGTKQDATTVFLDGYNSGLLFPALYKALGTVSARSLYRWVKTYKESGNDYYSLINQYNYGSKLSVSSLLSNQEKVLLLKYMLHQNKFSLGRAYELIKFELAKTSENISSYSSYSRVWKFLQNNYADKIAYSRGGKKFVTDTQMPYIVRDWSKVPAGEMLVGDGHTLDFMIKDPYTGKPTRATLVGFVDCATRDLAGYEIMLTENTQCIASALRNAIQYTGKVPKVVQLDNGRAFKSKFFNNSDLENSNLNGVYARLGIKTYYSRAYNGRAKVIERFFKEFTESLAKLISSYCGGSIETKPAYMMRNEKDHIMLRNLNGSDCPTIEEIKTYINFWLENIYRKRACNFDPSRSIEEVMNSHKGSGVNTEILDDMLCGYDKRKCGRNGIVLFSQHYFNPKLLGISTEVIIKYSLANLNSVVVYTIEGEKICTAERIRSVCAQAEIFGTPEDMNEYKRQLREIKQLEKARLNGVKQQLKVLYKNPVSNSTPDTKDIGKAIKPIKKAPTIDIEGKILEMLPSQDMQGGQYRCANLFD